MKYMSPPDITDKSYSFSTAEWHKVRALKHACVLQFF